MLYLSLVLQMTPWQADTEQLRKEFRDLLDPSVSSCYSYARLTSDAIELLPDTQPAIYGLYTA